MIWGDATWGDALWGTGSIAVPLLGAPGLLLLALALAWGARRAFGRARPAGPGHEDTHPLEGDEDVRSDAG